MGRIEPLMPADAYKTYAVVSPLSTHFRPATCAEVDCPHYVNGWRVRIETLTPDLLRAARNSGRKYTEQHRGGRDVPRVRGRAALFPAATHRTRMDRPPLYLVRDGDHRGNPRRTRARQHLNPDNWVEDFADHQQKLADEIQKG
jgi:hypothetical protein